MAEIEKMSKIFLNTKYAKNKIKMVFDIGGGKLQSSSDLVKPFENYSEERPWGNFEKSSLF